MCVSVVSYGAVVRMRVAVRWPIVGVRHDGRNWYMRFERNSMKLKTR